MRLKRILMSGIVATGVIMSAAVSLPSSATAENLNDAWQYYNQGRFIDAVDIWQKLAAAGNADALYNLGVMYREGKGVARDKVITHNLWKMAAEKKHPRAMHNLGLAYIAGDVKEGNDSKPDFKKAFEMLEEAADKGFPNSLYTLGKLYGYGLGVAKDPSKEVSYYILAAQAGSAKAQYNMGKAHRDGAGVVKDDKISFTYFSRAAKQGHTRAQNRIASRYATGRGVDQSDVMALKWALISRDAGNEKAEENIKSLKVRMSDAQIAEARKLASEFTPEVTRFVPKKRKTKG